MPAQYKVKCKNCGSLRTRVVTGHATADGIIRRRRCEICLYRWYTFQPLEQPISEYALTWRNKKPFLKNDDSCRPRNPALD
jgi:transcriptional regulator NrdR family protein